MISEDTAVLEKKKKKKKKKKSKKEAPSVPSNATAFAADRVAKAKARAEKKM